MRFLLALGILLSSYQGALALGVTPLGEFSPDDCKGGNYILRVEIPGLSGHPRAFADVFIRGVRIIRPLPSYLYERPDGWTEISSAMGAYRMGAVTSNCLPEGLYHVRIEYYERKPFLGPVLVAVYGSAVGIGDHAPVEFDQGWRSLSVSDYGEVFVLIAFYVTLLVLTAFGILVVFTQSRRGA